jgi:hypothetical protein
MFQLLRLAQTPVRLATEMLCPGAFFSPKCWFPGEQIDNETEVRPEFCACFGSILRPSRSSKFICNCRKLTDKRPSPPQPSTPPESELPHESLKPADSAVQRTSKGSGPSKACGDLFRDFGGAPATRQCSPLSVLVLLFCNAVEGTGPSYENHDSAAKRRSWPG